MSVTVRHMDQTAVICYVVDVVTTQRMKSNLSVVIANLFGVVMLNAKNAKSMFKSTLVNNLHKF